MHLLHMDQKYKHLLNCILCLGKNLAKAVVERCQVLHAVSYKLPTQYTEQCLYKGGWVVNTFTTRFALVVRYDGFGHTLLFSEEKKYFSFII